MLRIYTDTEASMLENVIFQKRLVKLILIHR